MVILAFPATPALKVAAGALVMRVGQRTANEIGVQAGDVIFGVNNRRVSSAEDIAKAINHQLQTIIRFRHGG